MIYAFKKVRKTLLLGSASAALALVAVSPAAYADEAQAKEILKAMSDYMGKQPKLSFSLDSSLEVVTKDQQKLSLASSAAVTMVRPNQIHMTRTGGFAEVELYFNGKDVALHRKDEKTYATAEVPGTIENLVDVLRDKYQRPLPAADLLLANSYDTLMADVTDVKDLGSGVIRGVECDHLAFRTADVDWQIWIAQGKAPYPVRMIISSAKISGTPQYQIDVMNLKTGTDVADVNYSFVAPAGVKKVDAAELKNFDELPEIFKPAN